MDIPSIIFVIIIVWIVFSFVEFTPNFRLLETINKKIACFIIESLSRIFRISWEKSKKIFGLFWAIPGLFICCFIIISAALDFIQKWFPSIANSWLSNLMTANQRFIMVVSLAILLCIIAINEFK